MIPRLVAIIAGADDADNHRSLESALDQVRAAAMNPGSRPHELLHRILGSPPTERLPALPVRRLVPDAPQRNPGTELLELVTPEALLPGLRSAPDGISVKAGLFAIHDHLDAAHELAQSADHAGRNTSAAYWHGIMHRREPDYDNARYWFRRVGQHAIFPSLGAECRRWLEDIRFATHLRFDRLVDARGRWDPMAFIDLCEECGRTWDDRARAAAELQATEMRLLLEYTCRAALGET